MMKVYKKAILPKGFKANGVASGIRKLKKLDLALLYSVVPAKAACLFTANKIQAAPIQISRKYLRENKKVRAIIVNSGNANCFTGAAGLRDAQEVAGALGKNLGIKKKSILVSSTGIIGKRLPVQKIKKALPGLIAGLSAAGIAKAKRAIMTTDTFAKELTVKFDIAGRNVTLCAIAKGAGMIAPDLATMLCFILSDANITQRALEKGLKIAVEDSFNCITVDGCMSTNDTVAILANAACGNDLIDTNRHFNIFVQALKFICLQLAKMIVRDAEGATKFIRIRVGGAKNSSQAKKVALGIANSNLFKTAVYGQNPNFGRIASAAGASGVDLKEKDLKIKVSPLDKKEISVEVGIGRGHALATVYTSDLTPEYIKINAEYN